MSLGCSSGSGAGHPDSDDNPGDGEDASCGVGPAYDHDGGTVSVDDAGVVTFDAVQVGNAVDEQLEVKDSADVSETILGATITGSGADAFQVTSTFPIAVPAGQAVRVDIRFTPPSLGDYSATLVLQTMKMGPSSIPLEGSGD